ncbi:CotH kinase family protein [Colwelliaceae bacterium 6471]
MKYSPHILCSLLISSSVLIGCGGSTDAIDTSSDTDTTTSDNTTPTSSTLVINEIVADAIDGDNDWIELYALDGTVELANYSIVDDNSDHVPQALPDVSLAEGEFIVIHAIDEADTPPEGGYYVTFKLGSDDAVILFKNGEQVDELDWNEGDAAEGTSYGLFTDGTGSAQTLSPTKGEPNQAAIETETVVRDLIINENALLRINEVVAKDSAGGYDWIELFVTGSSSINLSDYTIADENNELVSLPNVTLASGEFYRIYATTDVAEELSSVSFKLGASDQVSLYRGDDLIDQLTWKKGLALISYSYGRFPDGSDATQILSPSPLATNQRALHGSLVINEIVANDINDGDDWFELYNNSNENISLGNYHVIDESDDIEPASLPNITLAPGEFVVILANEDSDNDYSVPFTLGNNDELSLILNDETVDYIDWDASDVVAGFSYGPGAVNNLTTSWDKDFLTPTQGVENQLASAFNADVVHDLAITITTDNWQDILANPLDEAYHDASITFNGVTLDSVAIRTKGNSSLSSVARSGSDRYSFKIDINKYVDGQKFFGLKKFTLQNSFNDPSYMREVIAYDLLKEMGVASPEHAYVNVYVNGELFGFYLMVEAIDGEFLENHFANANGDLYKPDGVGSDLLWINGDIDSYSDINLQTNEDTTDNGAFINFVDRMDEGETDIIDVDSLLRYMSVSVALSNLDSYHGSLAHNYYLYEQDGVFSLLPWDLNEAFGSFSMGCDGVDVRELYIDEPIIGPLADRPMVANVFNSQENLATYHDYLWQLIEGPLSSDEFGARVANIAELISEHVANDPSAFYSYDDFERNLNTTVERFYGLTEFMDYRVNNMVQQLQGNLPTSGDGSGFCTGGGPPPPP